MSLEALIVFAVIYLVLGSIAKKGRKELAEREAEPKAGGTPADNDPAEGGLSLDKILKEIERVKAEAERRQAPPPRIPPPKPRFSPPAGGRMGSSTALERGTKGRFRIKLPESSEEGGSLEVEERVVSFDEGFKERGGRSIVDQDEQAEQVVRRRLDAAEHRTREGREAAYQAQQKSDRDAVAAKTQAAKTATDRLRSAIIWREILGPPVGLRD